MIHLHVRIIGKQCQLLLLFLVLLFSAQHIKAQDTITAGPDATICIGDSVRLGGNPTAYGISTSYQYVWSSNPAGFVSVQSNPFVQPTVTTTYYLEVDPNMTGTLYDTVTVEVVSPPNPLFTNSDYVCFGDTVSFSNNSTNATSYQWNFGDGGTSTAIDPDYVYDANVTGNGITNYAVTLTASNQGCSANNSKVIHIKQLPDPSIVSPVTGFNNCGNASTTNPSFLLEIYNISNTNNTLYSVDWGDGSSSFDTSSYNIKDHTYSNIGVYNVTSTVTGANGCVNSETHTVKNISNPAIVFGNAGNSNGCSPIEFCFPISGFSNNDTSTVYTINFGDGTPPVVFNHPPPDSICHIYTETSCGNIESFCTDCFVATITAKNACDSTANTTSSIRVFKKIETNLIAPIKACVNQNIQLSNASSHGFNQQCDTNALFVWDFDDGTTQVTTSYNSTVNHSYSIPGIYEISLKGENYCGVDSVVQQICVVPPVTADFNIPAGGCAPQTISLNNLTISPGTCDTTTYNWTVNGVSVCDPPSGSYSFVNGTSASSFEPQIEFYSSGVYEIKLSATNYCNTHDTTRTIVIKSEPQATLNSIPDSICTGEPLVPSANIQSCQSPATYNWSLPGSSMPGSTSNPAGQISYSTPGWHTITLEVINSCGSIIVTKDIYVKDLPAVSMAPVGSICQNSGPLSLTGGMPSGGVYTGTGVSGGVFYPQVAGAGTHYVKYTYTAPNGCVGADSVQITVDPVPLVSMQSINDVCLNDAAFALNGGTPINGTYYYSGNGVFNDIFYPDSAGPGTHTIYYVFENMFGCRDSASTTIQVHDLPLLSAMDTTLCNQPISAQLLATPPGGFWLNGPYNNTSGIFTPGNTGIFEVFYFYTDPLTGCSNMDTSTVTVIPAVFADAGADTSVCLNSGSFSLTSGSPPGGSWNGSMVNPAGVFSPTTPGVHTVYYSYGMGTCLTEDSVEITVHDLPVADAGQDTLMCENDSIQLNGSAFGGLPSYSFTWSPANSLNTTNGSSVYASPSVNEIYKLQVEDANGCFDSSFVAVEVKELPDINANDLNLCIGDSGIINTTINGNGPYNFNWSPNQYINNTSVQSPLVYPPVDTSYIIQVEDVYSCVNYDTSQVSLYPYPVPDFTASNTSCSPADVAFNNTTTNLGANTYFWDFKDGTTSTQTSPVHTFINASHIQDTTFDVSLYATGIGGCTDSITKPVTVLPQPKADFEFDSVQLCAPVVISVTNKSEYKPGNTQFIWECLNSSAVGIDTTNPVTPMFSFPDNQSNSDSTYYIQLTVISVDGCRDTLVDSITIHRRPQAVFSLDTSICGPAAVQVQNQSQSSVSYQWLVNPSSNVVYTPNAVSPVIDFPLNNTNDSILYTIKLTATSNAGCKDSLEQIVTVYPKPVAGFSTTVSDSCSPVNASFTNFSDAKNGEPFSSLTFVWDFNNGDSSVIANPSSVYTNSGVVDSAYQVTLKVETMHGCMDTASDIVTVFPDPVANFNPTHTSACAPFTLSDSLINLVQYQQANDSYQWTVFNQYHTVITTYQGPNFNPYTILSDNDTIYVQLITTNDHQCKSDTQEVMFHTLEDPVSNFSMSVLEGCSPLDVSFNNQTTPSTAGASWNFGDGTTSSILNPVHSFVNPSFTQDTTFDVRLISTSGAGCADTSNHSVTVYAQPKANFNHMSSCLGVPTIFMDSSLSGASTITLWKWDFGDGDSTFVQNPTHIYSNAGLYNVSLSITNARGCIDTITKPVDVYPFPTIDFDHDSMVCAGDSVFITNNTTGAVSYSWTFGNNTTSNIQSPVTVYSNPGTYQIKLVATTAEGCVDSLMSTIHVVEPPLADFVTIPDSGCAPLNVFFQNQSTGYQNSYFWNFGNGQTSNAQQPAPITFQQGQFDTTYYPSLTAANICGINTMTDSVEVRAQPQANFIPNKYIGCSPVTISFTDNLTKGTPDTLIWFFGDTTAPLVTTQSTFSQPVQHTYTTGSSITQYTVTYIAKNSCGADTMTRQITVLPNTVDAFFNTDTLFGCPPLQVNFTNHSLGYTSVYWDFGDGNVSNQISPSHTYTQSGTYDVELIVTDSCSYDTSNVTIQVYPLPTVDFLKSTDTVCVGEPITFTNNSPNPLSSLNWSFGDGDSSAQGNPSHAYQTSGTFTVSMTGYSALHNCPNAIDKSVTVLPTPNATITADTNQGCPPLNIQFQADSAYNTWYFGNGNTSNLANVNHTYTNPGSYTVTLISEFLNGCSDTAQTSILVHQEPTALFDQSIDSICGTPVDVLFTNSSVGASTFLWQFGNGNTSMLNDSITNVFNNPGNFTNRLIASNQFGCSDTASQNLLIYPQPYADATMSPTQGCAPLSVQFNNQSLNSNNYLWLFGDGNSSTSVNPVHNYILDGDYEARLISYRNNLCSDTLRLKDTINVYPQSIADFDYTMIHIPIYNSGKVQFNNLSSAAGSYFWDFDNGKTDTAENPFHRFTMYGDYLVTLWVNNQYGCEDTISKLIQISEFHGLYVSNAFSPEYGPPEVRTFKPKGVGLKQYHIQIYDTWGNLVWESNKLLNTEPAEGWDGTDQNGKPLPQDTYVWRIEAVFEDGSSWPGKTYEDGTTRKYGTVTLIR